MLIAMHEYCIFYVVFYADELMIVYGEGFILPKERQQIQISFKAGQCCKKGFWKPRDR